LNAILVFIDGTICDTRQRHPLLDSPLFYDREWMLKDAPVPGSVECIQQLATHYEVVYLGARPPFTQAITEEWLARNQYPKGPVFLASELSGRLELARQLKSQFAFVAGIGDRWDDNTIHAELGCLSIILKEFEGEWQSVCQRVEDYHLQFMISGNKKFVEGKVEGLARVCPLLLKKFGNALWDAYRESVREMAESTRDERQLEDLQSFKKHTLDPSNLQDMAKWYKLLDDENRETESLFGLQERELVESTPTRYVEKVSRCYLAELWKKYGKAEIGYQIHCRTDAAWWDRPAWNSDIRFEQTQTLMQGADFCIFIQYLPETGKV
jgi:hypothetical protein